MKTERVWAICPKFFRTAKFLMALMLSLSLALVSCSKDDEEEGSDMKYLEGSPRFDLPMYVMVGDVLEITASGVVTEGVKYTWSFPGLDSLSVAGAGKETIRLRVPDTLRSFNITVTANASDEYYGALYNASTMSVGENSLTDISKSPKFFVDPRDGQGYGIVEIGNLEWFDRNLNWNGAGHGYGKTDAAAYVFGRLYT